MICLSIGNVSCDEAKSRMLSTPADLVELRLDLIENANLEKLLGGTRPPVIVTNRPEREGGEFTGDETERLSTLEEAMKLGAEYVDIEWDSTDKLQRTDPTRIIVSRHDFKETPSGLDKWAADMRAGADIVKIVTTAANITDNFKIFDLLEASDAPTVAFCMGEAGAMSRILGPAYGSSWTYAAESRKDITAPDQFSVDEMIDLYRLPSISRTTKIFGVMANPVGHSMSPLVHNSAFAKVGMDAVYLPLLVADNAVSFIREFTKRFPVGGFSVTIPHKETSMEAMDEMDDYVRRAGALNTIVVRDGVICGYNTDIPAAMSTIEKALPNAGIDNMRGTECFIMGSGGAGRAIALGIKNKEGSITITDGIREKGERLAKEIDCPFVPWDKREDVKCDIIINATPIGMSPKTDASPLSADSLKKVKLIFDVVYNPPITKLLRDARKAGIPTASGLDMFVNQAAMQFELWTKEPAPADLMRAKIIERLA